MFYDTSTLQHNGGRYHVDLRTAAGRRWFYGTIRNFFSLIPHATPGADRRQTARVPIRLGVCRGRGRAAVSRGARILSATDFGIRPVPGEDARLARRGGRPVPVGRGPASATAGRGGLRTRLRPFRRARAAALGPGPRRRPRSTSAPGKRLLARPGTRRQWLVHLETWNEFHEGTEICHSREYGRQYIELTRRYADQFHAGQPPPPP